MNKMSRSKTSELEDYARRLGEHINIIYSKIDELNIKINDNKEELNRIKAEIVNNVETISNVKENTVEKLEFEEFVDRLTESLRNLLPPVPEETNEGKNEEE